MEPQQQQYEGMWSHNSSSKRGMWSHNSSSKRGCGATTAAVRGDVEPQQQQ
jgi:hypothetical protein